MAGLSDLRRRLERLEAQVQPLPESIPSRTEYEEARGRIQARLTAKVQAFIKRHKLPPLTEEEEVDAELIRLYEEAHGIPRMPLERMRKKITERVLALIRARRRRLGLPDD